jgi:hypothetical protein
MPDHDPCDKLLSLSEIKQLKRIVGSIEQFKEELGPVQLPVLISTNAEMEIS